MRPLDWEDCREMCPAADLAPAPSTDLANDSQKTSIDSMAIHYIKMVQHTETSMVCLCAMSSTVRSKWQTSKWTGDFSDGAISSQARMLAKEQISVMVSAFKSFCTQLGKTVRLAMQPNGN